MSDIKYIITSGWWSTEESLDERKIKSGSPKIRGVEFHQIWLHAIKTFCNPLRIYTIDSNSPIKPLVSEAEELIELIENSGHSTNHTGKLCGVSRAHLLGMSLALANEVDYWVYIEQDALIYGKGIIEKAIFQMEKPYMFGEGFGTPQPTQQSLMIIKTEAIPDFIKNFSAIKSRDNDISPEVKFAIATSAFLRILPESLFRNIHAPSIKNKVVWKLFKWFRGYDTLPFGYGRKRPISFDDEFFYFQHATEEELAKYLEKIGIQI